MEFVNRFNITAAGMRTGKGSYGTTLQTIGAHLALAMEIIASLNAIKDIALIAPRYLEMQIKDLEKCMDHDAPEDVQVPTDYKIEKLITSELNDVTTLIVARMNEMVKQRLIAANVKNMVDRGSSIYRGKFSATDDAISASLPDQQNLSDYNRSNSNIGNSPTPKQDVANDIGLPSPDRNGVRNHKPSVRYVDPSDSPSLTVNYAGKRVSMTDITSQDIHKGGLNLMPGRAGEPRVVRPDYSTYVKENFQLAQRSNLHELATFAQTSGIGIVVKDMRGKHIESMSSNRPNKLRPKEMFTAEFVFFKDKKHPDGVYVLVQHGTLIQPVNAKLDYDKGVAAQMVYLESRAKNKSREESLENANNPDLTVAYLKRAQEVATTSPDLALRYNIHFWKDPNKVVTNAATANKTDVIVAGDTGATTAGETSVTTEGDVEDDEQNSYSFIVLPREDKLKDNLYQFTQNPPTAWDQTTETRFRNLVYQL